MAEKLQDVTANYVRILKDGEQTHIAGVGLVTAMSYDVAEETFALWEKFLEPGETLQWYDEFENVVREVTEP